MILLAYVLAILENKLNALCMRDMSGALIIPSSPDSVLLINLFVHLCLRQSLVYLRHGFSLLSSQG